jgi:hypothetical protein
MSNIVIGFEQESGDNMMKFRITRRATFSWSSYWLRVNVQLQTPGVDADVRHDHIYIRIDESPHASLIDS